MIDKAAILTRIKEFLGITSDADLARSLGVAPATLSNWRSRGSIDYDLVFSKCKGVDLNWLLMGRGPMLRTGEAAPAPEPTVVYQRDPRDIETIADKNKIIKLHEEANAALRRRIAELEDRGFQGGVRSADAPITPGKNPYHK